MTKNRNLIFRNLLSKGGFAIHPLKTMSDIEQVVLPKMHRHLAGLHMADARLCVEIEIGDRNKPYPASLVLFGGWVNCLAVKSRVEANKDAFPLDTEVKIVGPSAAYRAVGNLKQFFDFITLVNNHGR